MKIGLLVTLAEGPNPVHHVVNHVFWRIGDWWVWSSHQGNLILAGIIMIFLGRWIARNVQTGPDSQGPRRYVTNNPFAQMIEVICVYLRENTVRPLLGSRTDRFMPFLWTLFFFILINNLLGLIPLIEIQHFLFPAWKDEARAFAGSTATQNIWVTGVLAFISFLVINAAGMRELGVRGYFAHLTAGAPVYVAPMIVLIEFLGIFIKPIALCIRLFANMTAGHILVATLFMFVGMAMNANVLLAGGVTLLSGLAAIAIYFLELFVAFLQAFVFMFLTAVFISLLEHHHDHEHEEHHALAPA